VLRYFLVEEVVNRVASDKLHRNAEWYGAFKIYLPTLLLGTLPWLPVLLAAAWRARHDLASRLREDAGARLLACWIALPAAVFFVSRSRLPLYVLPLFVPLALAVAQQSPAGAAGWPARRWLVAWALLLLALRIVVAHYPSDQDASAWARAIKQRVDTPVREVVFVEDMPRYGLHLYLDAEVETLSLDDLAQSAFNPEYDESLATELTELANETGVVFVMKQKFLAEVDARARARGLRIQVHGAPFHGRVILTMEAAK
jgi:hypothetical protein